MEAQKKLIHFIGQKIGLNDLALDQDRQVTVSFDDEITVTFLAEQGGELAAVSYVCDYQADQEQIARHLLSLNYLPSALGGGKLALSPKDQSIVLKGSWNAEYTDGEAIYSELEQFVNAVSAVRQEIEILEKQNSNGVRQDLDANPGSKVTPNPLMMYGSMA